MISGLKEILVIWRKDSGWDCLTRTNKLLVFWFVFSFYAVIVTASSGTFGIASIVSAVSLSISAALMVRDLNMNDRILDDDSDK